MGFDTIEVSSKDAEEIQKNVKLHDNMIDALEELRTSRQYGLISKVFRIIDAEIDALVGYVVM